MKSKKTLITFFLLILGVIVLVNILADRFFFRLDLTQDHRYTLSKATKDILKNLDEPVTITAYFSENLPPDYDNIRRDFKDMLVEYANRSKGMLVYDFVNPLKDTQTENKAEKDGVMPLQIPTRQKDEIKLQKAYMGAVVQMGESSEVIPAIQKTTGLEYNLSTAIKKLTVKDKPRVGILRGQGEAPLQQMNQVVNDLEVLYKVDPVTMTDTTSELSKFRTVAIVAPTDSFPPYQLAQLDTFLAKGGGLFIALNRVDADLNKNPVGHSINTGLETWLSKKGINVNDNFVVDKKCAPVNIQMQQGPFSVTQQIPFHYFPVIQNFADNPISSGLGQVVFQFVSSISYSGDSTLTYIPLLKTSEKSGTLPADTYFDLRKEWSDSDFPLSNLVVAAALKGKIVGKTPSRMVVVGDGNFPVDGGRRNQINPDNANLMVNSIDWLSDDTGLINLRTKGATARPIKDLSDAKRTTLKWLNFLLPLILIIIYGIFRLQRNQHMRIKRMEEGYV